MFIAKQSFGERRENIEGGNATGWEALRWVEWHFAWRGTYNMIACLSLHGQTNDSFYINNNNHNNICSVELFTTASFLLMMQQIQGLPAAGKDSIEI